MAILDWLALASDKQNILYASLALVVPVLLVRYKHKPRYPPSPSSLPIVGHLLWLSSGFIHLDFSKIGEQLGSDIIFLKVFGQQMVVLNSLKAASDLLEKRSGIYSDRSCPPFGKDPTLFDFSDNLAMLGYNDTWRHHRRMLNKWLNARAVTQFNGLLEYQTALLLRRLLTQLTHPRPFEVVGDEFFFTTGSAMLKLAYGYQLESKDDKFFQDAQLVLTRIVKSFGPTGFAVNIFPFLIYIPSWFPGTGWKRTAREWREHKDKTYKSLYEWTKSQVVAGTAVPSVLSYLLQDEEITAGLRPEEKELRLKELSIALYGGKGFINGITSGTLMKFVAAMVLNPSAQAKAQKEIDSIIGPDTLPNMSDRDRLPYVRNLILEVLRMAFSITGWCSAPNTWAMGRDKAVYEDPELFNPDRFLDSNVPHLAGFGWGRRICPGLHFA
ncbi:unnamed protein product [Rhizoctonia solani]|uniref:O-methylsterigmatocystin oxidoreductase n=1 Tax=Rhizoctonia solani TaxID=456999 RepID=A0A8H2WFH8_9AGAM|nr:unnamed protein product [Rhizoctonia solani]